MKRKVTSYSLFIATCVCMIAVIALLAVSTPSYRVDPISSPPISVSSGWKVVEDGEEVSAQFDTTVPVQGNTLTLERMVNPKKDNDILFFLNTRQGVTIRADGHVIYQIGEEGSDRKLNSTNYCVAQLPLLEKPYLVQLTFTNLQNGECLIPALSLCTINDVIAFMGEQELLTVMMIPVWVTFFFVLVALIVLFKRWRLKEDRIIYMAIFMLLAVGWIFTDSYFIALLPLNLEICATLSYYCLMLMPVPIILFVQKTCNNRRPVLAKPFLIAVLSSIVIISLLYLFNVCSFRQLLFVQQIFMVLSVVFGFACMIFDYRAQPSRTSRLQMVAFGGVFLMGAASVIVYWLVPGVAYRTIFQLCMLFFVIMMLVIVAYSATSRNYSQKINNIELETYRKLSKIDSLTGIYNRRSFDVDIERVWETAQNYPNAQLVFLDLNGLKYTNDLYGHMAGDDLIVATAAAVKEAFELVGKTYRIGGDEFAVIVKGPTEYMYSAIEKMDDLIRQFNETHELSISVARGFSSLFDPLGHKRSVSDWKTEADKNMYRNKLQLGYAFVRGSKEDYQEIISSFASAVDAKDSYTADHSGRVGTMSDKICLMLGLSETSTSQIHTAARLHDIGKIGIPDHILGKKGGLSKEEWRIIRSHPVVGENIVKHTKAFYEVSQIIRHHHERFDGSGYPDGIAGNDIPIGARIIAIADSIDAMTSNRSYRDAREILYCKEEIRKNLGTLYDPAIGQIVLEHWKEIEEVVITNPKNLQVVGPAQVDRLSKNS